MPRTDRTTSIKLDPDLRTRLKVLADVRHSSVHALMKEAVARFVLREEMAVWSAYLDKHKTVYGQDVPFDHWLQPREPVGLPEHVMNQIAAGNNRVRVLRGWRGMTMAKLLDGLNAMGADLGEPMLLQIEDGHYRPGPGLAVMLARVLDVRPEDVTG